MHYEISQETEQETLIAVEKERENNEVSDSCSVLCGTHRTWSIKVDRTIGVQQH